MSDLREQLLKLKPPVYPFEVQAWRQAIFIRPLTTAEYREYEKRDADEGEKSTEAAMLDIARKCIVDKDGNRLFLDDDSIDHLVPSGILEVYAAVMTITHGQYEDIKKN